MIIDADFKPWLLTELKRTPALSGALYDKKEHALKVTNGKALVILPVRDDGEDEDGIIPADALKEAAKLARGRTALPCSIVVKAGVAALRDGRSWPLIMTPGAFPCIEQVIPNKIGWTRTARIMFDPELLYQLAEAAGAFGKYPSRSVIMEFETDADGDAAASPVLVTTGKARTAVLMPMRWGGDKAKKASDVPTQEAR